MPHTSERFFTSAVESPVVPPGTGVRPESITVPLINDSRDAEKPDSAKTTINVWPRHTSGSGAGTVVLGAPAGASVVAAAAAILLSFLSFPPTCPEDLRSASRVEPAVRFRSRAGVGCYLVDQRIQDLRATRAVLLERR